MKPLFKDEWRTDGMTTTELSAVTGVQIASMVKQGGQLVLKKNRHRRFTPTQIRRLAVARTKMARPIKDDERERWDKLLGWLGLDVWGEVAGGAAGLRWVNQ